MRFSRGQGLLALAAAVFVLLIIVVVWRRPAPVSEGRPKEEVARNASGDLVVDPQSPILHALVVAHARSVALPHITHFPGVVASEPSRSVSILTPVAGRVVSVSAAPGAFVTPGQVLAVLASGDLAQAYADQQKAQSALTLAHKAFTRAQGVLAVGGNAAKDLDSARNDLGQAEAEATRADQRLNALNANAAYSTRGLIPLVAPVDGIISTVTMAPGNMVTDLTAVQMTMVDLSEIWVNAQVPEDQITQIAVGETAQVTLTAAPGHVIDCHIASLDPTLHPDSRRLEAHAACANPDGLLRPNMFGDVAVTAPEGTQVMVPQSALLMNNDAVNVYVEVAPRTFRRQRVEISYDEGEDVRVLSGLSADARIVTAGGILLNDD